MSVDIHKEDIPKKFVNPTLQREMVSIWDVVQLIGHGACDLSSMPKEIRAKVDAELERRHNYNSPIRFKGIYGLEKLECGCQIKHYKGGKTILEASYKCTLEPRHITTVKHVCVNCGFEGTKLELKQHKWTHAYDA